MAEQRDPHQEQPVVTAGAPLQAADAAMILAHGRGATAQSILMLAQEVTRPGIAYLAPQAAHNAWYPVSFMAPIAQNQPYLTSALAKLGAVLAEIEAAGIPAGRTILLGFSQGACLSVEYAARHPQRYGGVAVLSGGLIGPAGHDFDYDGSLDGTPIFLGCSDVDPHIPKERVEETAQVLRGMGADVTERLYPGLGHTVNQDELSAVRQMMDEIIH